MPAVVVVSGLPGSGKTTLAVPLAAHLGLPLLRKDHIKEVLADSLAGYEAAGPELGRAAVRLMFELARYVPDVVLESYFWPGLAEPDVRALGRPLVQVHCACPEPVARERFAARIRAGDRHGVHSGEAERWARYAAAGSLLDLPAPLVEVDTTSPVDVAAVAARVRAGLAAAPPALRSASGPDVSGR